MSHCCRGWTINIDKKTYKKYKTVHQIEIKEITDKHLIKYPKGSGTNQYSFALDEVVCLVLFQPDSMKYEENTVIEKIRITEKRVIDQSRVMTQEHQIIQLFCSHLIMAESPFIEDNLYALTQFIVFL
ncbi:hypothetical protein [Arsenophonus endosymbiont of Aleurodicus floccissimus]|uniref:hypothetical protein n=1 Tax=Arsenophonus endosymbiont of Aleurodicus floccissimus TaxID=2152761 RepID=UPI000E6B47FE|nr:hypothetical protein [Arsenophonus endosymbiont of Aleurodicus floccissimus]